jgi:hypothetical protein
MAPGGGGLVAGKGANVVGAAERPAVPPWSAEEQLALTDNAAAEIVAHNSERDRHQRTQSIYATLAAVMERATVLECCRP